MIDNFATGTPRQPRPSTSASTLVEDTIVDPELVDEAFARLRARRRRRTPRPRTRIRTTGQRTRLRTRSARRTSCKASKTAGVGGSSTSRPRSATACTRSSSRSRSTTRCAPATRATRSPRPRASTTSQLSGLDWVSFRLANAYGPRNVSGPLPTFFQRLTEGKPCFVMDTRRDFIYVAGPDRPRRAGARRQGLGRRLPRLLGLRLLDQGAVRRDRRRARLEPGARGRGARPRNPDDAFTILLDPSRTVERVRLDSRRRRSRRASRRAIEYYRDHGITETYTHLRLEQEKQPAQ